MPPPEHPTTPRLSGSFSVQNQYKISKNSVQNPSLLVQVQDPLFAFQNPSILVQVHRFKNKIAHLHRRKGGSPAGRPLSFHRAARSSSDQPFKYRSHQIEYKMHHFKYKSHHFKYNVHHF